jgi:hypothetical protein
MTFADLVAGDSLFVDANTLVYHCTLDPKFGSACTDLLDRIGRGEADDNSPLLPTMMRPRVRRGSTTGGPLP